jgi:TRAP-type C4-dicarboxylate transport system permease small subunit
MDEHQGDGKTTGIFDLPRSLTMAGRIADKIEIVLLFFAGAAFVSLGILIVNQVFFRYVLAAPPMWTEELTRYIFVWLSWLSAAVVFRRGQHITIDAIVGFVPERLRLPHDILIRFISVGILLFLLYYGVAALKFTKLLSAALEINMMYVYASAPVASFVMLVFAALDALESYSRRRRRTHVD